MSQSSPLRAVVAIPAKNEEERLGACLRALAVQQDGHGKPLPQGLFSILLFVNNSDDKAADLARAMAPRLRPPLRIIEQDLPPAVAHAGGARRAAMDAAAAWLAQNSTDGLLLTTDADSRVGPSWVADNLTEADAGADAIAGVVSLEPMDELSLPQALRERGRLEGIYERQLTEIAALLDPRPHNPWPHHATMSGASLAVKLSAYRRIGGLPALPLGEDKGLVATLEAHDAHVRFSLHISVVTSGRKVGRANGGVADTIRLRCEDPRALCDEMLEPARVAKLRAEWRGRLRRLHAEGALAATAAWAPRLGIDMENALGPYGASKFGMAWNHIERSSPVLRRRRLVPSDLPAQIGHAHAILLRLRGAVLSGDHVQSKIAAALAPRDIGEISDLTQEDLRRLIA